LLPSLGLNNPLQNLPGANSPLSGNSSPLSFGQQVQQPNGFGPSVLQPGSTSGPLNLGQNTLNLLGQQAFNNINPNPNPFDNINPKEN
jgi:hypothetical protein